MARVRRLLRRFALVAALLIGLVVFTAWLLRDHPRRLVEAALAEELGARVHLGRLEIEGLGAFVLHDLEVELQVKAWAIEAHIPRLFVQGDLGEIQRGRFQAVHVGSSEITARRADAPPPESEEGSESLRIARLRVDPSGLTLRTATASARITIEADVQDLGGRPHGEAGLRGVDVSTLPLLELLIGPVELADLRARVGVELATTCPSLSATLRLDQASTAVIRTAGSCRLPLRDDKQRSIELPSLAIRATLADGDGPARVELQAEILHQLELDATFWVRFDRAEIDATAPGTFLDVKIEDLATLLAAAGIEIVEFESGSSATIAARVGSDGRREVTTEISAPAVSWSDGTSTASISEAHFEGTLHETSGGDWTMAGAVRLGSVAGSFGEDARSFSLGPIDVEFEGAGSRSKGSGTARASVGDIRNVEIRGELRLEQEQIELSDVRARIEGVPLDRWLELAARNAISLPESVTVAGLATVEIRADGALSSPRLAVAIDVQEGQVAYGRAENDRIEIGEMKVSLRAERDVSGAIQFGKISVEGTLQAPEYPPLPFRAEGRAHLDQEKLSVPELSVAFPELLKLELTRAEIDPSDLHGRAHLSVTQADLARPLGWFELPAGLEGYELTASGSSEFELTWNDALAWTAEGTLAVEDLQIASEDYTRVAQGLSTTGRFRLDGTTAGLERGTLEADSSGFEILWGTLYGDWSGFDPTTSLRFGRPPDDPASWWLEAALVVDPTTRLDTEITGAGELLGFEATLRSSDLAALYAMAARDPLGESYPRILETSLAGTLDFTTRGTIRASAIRVAGSLEVDSVDWTGLGDELEVRQLSLFLPFDLSTDDGGASFEGPPLDGRLAFERFGVYGLPFPALDTGIEVEGDGLRVTRPISFPLVGGTVSLDAVAVRDLLRPAPYLRAALALRGLDLGELSHEFGLPRLEGKIQGVFPGIRLSSTELQVDGGGTLGLFGGTIEFSHISGRNVLSDYPEFTFSARFEEIDLGLVTRTFDVGEMTGIAQGYINDCALFAGSPTRFDALVETVERRGVKRAINVKAINNLAILGTGGSTSVFDRGIQKFFDRYTYEKLGVRAGLSNDAFLLTGTERRGQRELFLKGRLPLRIDIVNARPGRSVSFQAMVERLRSLNVGQATTGGN